MAYDIFVIGAGSGGVRAARRAAQEGFKVAISDGRAYGGTCVNRGCIPKKLYSFASHYQQMMKEACAFGFAMKGELDWAHLQKHKNKEIKRLNEIYEGNLKKAGVTLFHDFAHVQDGHHIECGGQVIKASKILLASGTYPRPLDIEGANHAMTSDDIFALPHLPSSMTIIGGGYIAVEMASILHGLGVHVRLIHRGARLLKGFENELGLRLQEAFGAQGIECLLECEVTQIEKKGDNYELAIKDKKGARHHHESAAVLAAVGRVPDTKAFAHVAIELDEEGFIQVNAHYQTSKPSIYALGDVIGGMGLTPVAIRQAERWVAHLTNKAMPPLDEDKVPTAIFSHPEIATAGLSHDQAIENYGKDAIHCVTSSFIPLRYSLYQHQAMEADAYRVTLKAVLANEKIVGLHMIGGDSAEIMQGLAVALGQGLTMASLHQCVGIHPTTAEEWVTL